MIRWLCIRALECNHSCYSILSKVHAQEQTGKSGGRRCANNEEKEIFTSRNMLHLNYKRALSIVTRDVTNMNTLGVNRSCVLNEYKYRHDFFKKASHWDYCIRTEIPQEETKSLRKIAATPKIPTTSQKTPETCSAH